MIRLSSTILFIGCVSIVATAAGQSRAAEPPIPARTVMSRLWQQFFGMGLSRALDDLGAQGEPPVTLGDAVVENITTVHDLHATMLNQLGIQSDTFTVKFQGLDAKFVGVEGNRVIREILV